jgi:hypothetical protein
MSKIKFGIGALEAARDNYKILFDRLVRGYKSVVGKDPEGLDLLKIKQEAKQRADESAKVVDMKNRTLDPSKPIMGGSQDFITRQKPKTKKADGGLAGFAGDQRFGFKKGGMSRRDFMKIIGGLAALPVVGKFFKAAEPVAKVATKATEGVKIGLDKFMMLVDKIKRSGRPAPGRRTQDLQEVTTYKGKDGSEYELTEDLATGDLTITKDKPGGAYYGDNAFETIDDRTIMEYKKGQPDVDPDSRTAFTTADEYEEGRAIANRDGEFDDIDEVDDRVVEEILEEIKPSKIKRAGGGLAYMLGE